MDYTDALAALDPPTNIWRGEWPFPVCVSRNAAGELIKYTSATESEPYIPSQQDQDAQDWIKGGDRP